MGEELGSGAFGVVKKAEAHNVRPDGSSITVAVKMLKGAKCSVFLLDSYFPNPSLHLLPINSCKSCREWVGRGREGPHFRAEGSATCWSAPKHRELPGSNHQPRLVNLSGQLPRDSSLDARRMHTIPIISKATLTVFRGREVNIQYSALMTAHNKR